MGEISAASGEQQTGIEQVNVAVSQMDEVTQQNAELVEEASAAAQSMAAQSATLRELVSVFKVPRDEDRSHIAATAAATRPARTAPKMKNSDRVRLSPTLAAAAPGVDSSKDWETL